MSFRYVVSAPGLPAQAGPISQAVVARDHCYVSGQLATDADGVFRSATAREEAERAFANLFAVLSAAGFSKDELVFVELAFIDLADLPEVNALFAELFAEGKRPARTVYQAAGLPYDGKIKVLGVAIAK